MNTFLKTLGIFALLLLLVSACTLQGVQVQAEEGAVPKAPGYQTVLGKSLSSNEVSDFVSSNACSFVGAFQLCREVGMALWIDADQRVNLVYLYSSKAEDFNRYRGDLPFGLTFYDPMWLVEEKLSTVEVDESSQVAYESGLPDAGSSPDHQHYWAVYEQLGLIVIYDFPYRDADAYIYAVVVKV